ncbi:hypothetical protein JB92DRAFT_3112389 [Gautieria morchelliformis]|nr:hypothetical protein JB92DRAFT_3112389 [Gautieria morchelliformis]
MYMYVRQHSGGNAEVATELTLTQRRPPLAKHAVALPHLTQCRATLVPAQHRSSESPRLQAHRSQPPVDPDQRPAPSVDDDTHAEPQGSMGTPATCRLASPRHSAHPGAAADPPDPVVSHRPAPGIHHVSQVPSYHASNLRHTALPRGFERLKAQPVSQVPTVSSAMAPESMEGYPAHATRLHHATQAASHGTPTPH